MKRFVWFLTLLLVLAGAMTGCNLVGGAEQEHAIAAQPLDPAAWPTPQPTLAPASPTPFPRVTLEPTATPTPRATGESSGPAAVSQRQELTFTGNIADLVQQVTDLSGGFPPVAAATVKAPDVALRWGPADTYASLGTPGQGELAAVLGQDAGGNWRYVLTRSGLQGWLPAQALQVTLSLGEAPVLPDNPLAPAPDQALSSAPAPANPLGGLEPVAVALVTAEDVVLRLGPAASHPSAGSVEQGELAGVLGTNPGGDWLYIITISGLQGWLPRDAVRVTGSLEGAPVLPANPLAVQSGASTAGGSSGGASQAASAGQASPAAVSGGPSHLVFQTSNGGDIMIANPDGTGLRRLTQGIDPALAPDGQTVAFTRWTGEDGSLWLIDVDGDHERAILGETKQAKHPAWSPDGQRLVVNFQHGGRLDPKRDCTNLIKLGDRNPDIPWNVDSDSVGVEIKKGLPYLCWTLPPDPHWGLRVVSLADGSFADMPSDAYAFGPDWDPANAWRIVSSGQSGLVQLDVNRAEQWALTDSGSDHTPVFSPDGRYLAVAYNNNGQYDIHRLNSDGSGRLALTKTPLWVTASGEQQPWNNVAPAWSPDGKQVAFLTDRAGRWEIWVMNADGTNQRPLFAPEVARQLELHYDFVDERVLSWR